jgi:hypothetical protein
MDEASKAARAAEQGMGPVLYRGHQRTKQPTSNHDMWMSSSIDDAQTYNKAANGFVHPDGMTPLRTNADNLAYVRGDGKYYDKVTTNSIKNPGIRQGIIKGTDDITEAVKESGQYQGTHFRNIKDEFHTASSTEPSDVYNILGSRPDVKIRHADAAYDPQYTGSNIMGNADPRLLAGTAAATAGVLAAPMAKDSGMISSPRAGWLWDTTMGLRDVERRLEGHPAGWLFPSGLVDYLETVNRREESPSWLTRGMALLDVMP